MPVNTHTTTDPAFYASGRDVFRSPRASATGTTLGFRVLTVSEDLTYPEGVAKDIASLLNKYWEAVNPA